MPRNGQGENVMMPLCHNYCADYQFRSCHRDLAAFLAISVRCFLFNALARAFPPFKPPNRPSATAAGFFPGSDGSLCSGWPSVRSAITLASWFTSEGVLLERLGMLSL